MRKSNGVPGGSYWTDGDMMFRVQGGGRELDRIVKIRRPFALVGRSADSDVCVSDPAVSDRHVYAHLDPRGVYIVDLLSRTGTRINGQNLVVGWLLPGQSFEVGGRRVTLLRMRINGEAREPEPSDDDLLAETNQTKLVGVTLEPSRKTDPPWVLGSELVFLGWSSSCGIQIRDKLVARAHCAIVRSGSGAYLVDLSGQNTWVGDQEVGGAALLRDGESVTIGSASFTVHLESPKDDLPAVPQATQSPLLPQRFEYGDQAPIPVELLPADSQNALLAWMMGTIQGGQGEVLRQQGEFQLAMTQLLREIQQDNAKVLNAHLERMEGMDRELAALRVEVQRRLIGPGPPALPTPSASVPASGPVPVANGTTAHVAESIVPPPPQVVPLRVSRTVPESNPKASTGWLLERVNQLENENRSAWKDLLGRLTALPRRTQ